jgi:hypothetical protein
MPILISWYDEPARIWMLDVINPINAAEIAHVQESYLALAAVGREPFIMLSRLPHGTSPTFSLMPQVRNVLAQRKLTLRAIIVITNEALARSGILLLTYLPGVPRGLIYTCASLEEALALGRDILQAYPH